MSKVSIIVPVYNIENYLSRCMESLLGQTCREVEILLVDDGSTDGSGRLCDGYAQRDSRVKVIHKENGGLSDARNAGLDAAKGEWLLFVDGDDYLATNAVEMLLSYAGEDTDFVQFHYRETDGTWQPESQSGEASLCADPKQMFQRLYGLGGVAASSCTKLWNRRVFDGVRFQKGILHEDEELLNRVLPGCKKAVYTDLVLYGYVMRPGSIIHAGFRPKQMDIFPIMEDRARVLEELELGELAAKTYGKMFQTAAWQYCLARRGGFRQEQKALKEKIVSLAKQPALPLSGQYKLLYRGAKVTPAAVDGYYFVRRLCGKS
ncbi:MAG: glycosyltransferase [Oscillospiraceae bacterium]|nr:glycosyltransferase [Oscillospiraceae bacterium]